MIRAFMPWMDTEERPVDLLIGLDNTQWLPLHVEDSWDPDDDMRLMKSAFGHRYMVMGGWGRSLYPRDPSWRRTQTTQREGEPKNRKRCRKCNWKSTTVGARAAGTGEARKTERDLHQETGPPPRARGQR
jgi:hypothetical protein